MVILKTQESNAKTGAVTFSSVDDPTWVDTAPPDPKKDFATAATTIDKLNVIAKYLGLM